MVLDAKFAPETVTLVVPGDPLVGVMVMLGGVWAQTEGVGNTPNADASSEMIRSGNIRRTRRCPNMPQADFEEPANISQLRWETTTLNAGKPRIPCITLAPRQGGVALIRV